MIIRPVVLKDYDQWLPLWQGYLSFYNTNLPDEVIAHSWARLHNEMQPLFCLVAEEEGKLIGLVHYLFHRSMWSMGDYCYLQDLFTKPEARGKGVGRKLIEAVYQEAQNKNANRVYWLTHETNYAGRTLYDKVASNLGFIQYRKML